jgi:hypothetical protein
MSCYYHSQLIIPYLDQILGFWGGKAILLCMQFALHAFILFLQFLPFCIRQNIFLRMVEIFHSITYEWDKFDDRNIFSYFSHGLPNN